MLSLHNATEWGCEAFPAVIKCHPQSLPCLVCSGQGGEANMPTGDQIHVFLWRKICTNEPLNAVKMAIITSQVKSSNIYHTTLGNTV